MRFPLRRFNPEDTGLNDSEGWNPGWKVHRTGLPAARFPQLWRCRENIRRPPLAIPVPSHQRRPTAAPSRLCLIPICSQTIRVRPTLIAGMKVNVCEKWWWRTPKNRMFPVWKGKRFSTPETELAGLMVSIKYSGPVFLKKGPRDIYAGPHSLDQGGLAFAYGWTNLAKPGQD